jgi:DNA-binding ferritin-like protein
VKYTLRDISHFDFFEGLENQFSEIINVLETKIDDETIFKQKADLLIYQTEQYLIKFIYPSTEQVLFLLDKSYSSIFDYDFSSYGFDEEPAIKKEINRLDKFKQSFRLTIGYLSMTNTLLNPDNLVLIESISDKSDFILSKLNSVFGNEEYSIEHILHLNNIKFRDNETREIAEELSKRGYLILKDKYGHSDTVKISVKGAKYIERKLTHKNVAKQKSELDKKIDTIIEHLIKLGYGQEVIFNEIGELRELQHKLSKKSWAQLLKGKLVDLALDKLLSVEAAKSVYEYLTSNNFKLLK